VGDASRDFNSVAGSTRVDIACHFSAYGFLLTGPMIVATDASNEARLRQARRRAASFRRRKIFLPDCLPTRDNELYDGIIAHAYTDACRLNHFNFVA